MSISGIPELKDSFRRLGPLKFLSTLAATVAWIALGVWLSAEANWPESFGFHCSGRGCLFVELWHSPALIHRGGIYPDAVFAWLWSMPAIVIGALAWRLMSKRRSTIEPMSSTNSPDREY